MLGFVAGAALLVMPAAAVAAPTPPFTQCPSVGSDTSCALLIYVDGANRVGVYGDPSQPPYDDIEDTLIGVQTTLVRR
jgi:hypothetical protein